MTQRDPLKDFIQKNRSSFDDLEANDQLWQRIEGQLPKQSTTITPLYIGMRIAAVGIILLATIWTVYQLQPAKPVSKEGMPSYALHDVSPEYAEVEMYYASEIDQLLLDIDPNTLDPSVREALQQLDEEYAALQEEMGEQIDNEKVIEAMIQTYRLKLEVLKDIYASMQSDKKVSHDVVDL